MTLEKIIDLLRTAGFTRRRMQSGGFEVLPDKTNPARMIVSQVDRTQVFTSDPGKRAAMIKVQIERRTRLLTEMAEALKRAGAAVELETITKGGAVLPVRILVNGK